MAEACDSILVIEDDDCNVILVQPTEIVAVIDVQDPPIIIIACEQGPPGQDGAGLTEVSSGPVSNGNTVVADSVVISVIRSVKWIVTLTDSIASDYKSYEVLAVHNGTIALHAVYALIGDVISVATNVVLNAGNMELEITNNSPNDLDIKVQRIQTTL